ncbi:ABC transporter ATP-binding protein [Actinoalloteichus caeruleus]|uniref:ABC transporter ATP-binding protein n=1 Tax=Actinoalloteichus cyanogriseus TaxID=2893586 RepID=UPI003AAA3DCB
MTTRWAVWRHLVTLHWRAHRRVVLLIALLAPLEAASFALVSVAQRHLADSATNGVLAGVLAAALLGGLGNLVISGVLRTKANLQADVVERVDALVSAEVLRTVTAVPTIEHLERTDYLDRLSLLLRGTRSLAFAPWQLVTFATVAVQVGLSCWLLFGVHPALVLLVLFAVPPVWAVHRAQRPVRAAATATAELRRHDARLHGMATSHHSARELRLAGAVDVVAASADRAWDAALDTAYRARSRGLGWKLGGWAIHTLGYLAALGLVAWLVVGGHATLGDLILFITLAGQLRAQLAQAADQFDGFAEALHCGEQYLWLRRYSAEHEATGTVELPSSPSGGIRLRDVGFTYPGTEEPVLSGVTVDIPQGSTVAVVGDNGAGKTTLVKLLTGMYRPTTGAISVGGVDLDETAPARWRDRVTAAFQDGAEFALPAGRAIGVGRVEHLDDREAVERAVDGAGAGELVLALPRGLDTQLGAVYDGLELSGGQWQQLALARAMMRPDAALTFLDEPTAALDPRIEHQLYERMARHVGVAGGAGTTILITHRFSTTRMADHILVLAGGRVVEQGRHRDLMARDGVYATLYRAQLGAYGVTHE